MTSSSTNGRAQLFLSIALLGLLLLFTILQSPPSEPRPYDPASAAPNGLLALRLWLIDMGYDLQETMGDEFQLPASTELLLIWPTEHSYTPAEIETLDTWVTAGGTAVIMGAQQHFGVRPGAPTPSFFSVTPQQPLLTDVTRIELTGGFPALDLRDAPAAVPLLVTGGGEVTAALQSYGAGTLWHLSEHHTMINDHLRDPAQAALLLAFLRQVTPGGTVRFDTYHLWGPPANAERPIQTMQAWLYYTPWGWALLFSSVATALFLLLQGRRLGPPLPTQAVVRRREAAEYVMAMANLARRARHREVIARHHKQRLKRALSRRAHIDITMNDDEFVAQLANRERLSSGSAQEAGTLRNKVSTLLQRLDGARDERALVEAVAMIDALLGQERSRTSSKNNEPSPILGTDEPIDNEPQRKRSWR